MAGACPTYQTVATFVMAKPMRKPELISGILLKWTSIEMALEALSISRMELETILGVTSEWPFPACLDGWKLAHDAIRFDMDALQIVMDATRCQVDRSKALTQWQVDALRLVVNEFYRTVHNHQDHKEEILFPWMETRVKLPPKLSAGHLNLTPLLAKVLHLTWILKPADAAAAKAVLHELCFTFSQLRALMRQHLEEEEIIGLPLMRKNFTAKEMQVPEKKIVSQMQPRDLAWFLRPMGLQDKKAAMSRLGVPGPVQWLVMLPACRKDERTVLQAYRDLAAGQRTQDGRRQQVASVARPKKNALDCLATWVHGAARDR